MTTYTLGLQSTARFRTLLTSPTPVHPLIVAGASLRWSASEESSAASEHDDENWGDERRAHVQWLRACDGVFCSREDASQASASKTRLRGAKLRLGLMSALLIIIN